MGKKKKKTWRVLGPAYFHGRSCRSPLVGITPRLGDMPLPWDMPGPSRALWDVSCLLQLFLPPAAAGISPSCVSPPSPHARTSSQGPPPATARSSKGHHQPLRGLTACTPVINNPSKRTEGLGGIKVIVCSKAPVCLPESLIYGGKFRL